MWREEKKTTARLTGFFTGFCSRYGVHGSKRCDRRRGLKGRRLFCRSTLFYCIFFLLYSHRFYFWGRCLLSFGASRSGVGGGGLGKNRTNKHWARYLPKIRRRPDDRLCVIERSPRPVRRVVLVYLPGFTEFYRVLLGFTEFYRVLLGFTRFDLVWLNFTGFD